MISKEEMYDFASQIAGITESDLEAYKCGGKTRKKQFGGNMRHTPSKQKNQGRRTVDPGNKPAWVAPAGPIANSRIHGNKNEDDYYESGTVVNGSMVPNGIRMKKLPNGDWVQEYPDGSSRTFVAPKRDKKGRIIPGTGDPNYEKVDRIATRNFTQSLQNSQKNGISIDR